MIKIYKKEDYIVEAKPWGSLTWYASREMGNASGVTTGLCVIKPGESNPRHNHPNCEEILHVLKGEIIHTYGGEEVRMEEGDTISVPIGIPHNAINIGTADALLSISFSSAERMTIGE